ncbi:uncharacterized protein LOC133030567 [Cannabis sativa]|uniref:uncharacterized protein LOC133030567 n=1 Tax=Cannabis sativa TaxID=3483 RepID=UPI0029CA912E|nr:uncharacterized protein LOC133030567 [Cannabis sativa]
MGGEESAEHLFLSCNFGFHLWRSSPWGIYHVTGSGIRVWDWVKFLWGLDSKGLNVEEVFIYASVVVDTIWRARNDKIHNNSSPNLDNCIDSTLCAFANLKDTLLPDVVPVLREGWRHPPQHWLKLNCDVRVGLGSSCIAEVARNHLGEVVWVHSARLDCADALCGEAASVFLALETTKLNDHKFVIVESDSRVVINSLNRVSSCWEIENYSNRCLELSGFFDGCLFSCIPRSCNFIAHNVAKWAFTHNQFGCLPISYIPRNLLCNDHEV